MPIKKWPVSTVLSLLLASTVQAAGADKDNSALTVTFDHAAGVSQSQAISARAGEVITIQIKGTCPDQFDYELGGIPLIVPADPALAGAECTPKTHTLRQVHDDDFGGYYIKITRKPGVDAPVMAKTSGAPIELKELDYVISVETMQWDIAFAGGFTISDLVDPVYASRPDDMMQSIVVRDKGAEDEASLGLAAMVHLYHRKNPQWAGTFGLSTASGSDVAYMLGGSYRFGDKGAITLGYMWAPVDRLPAGLSVGDPISDPNALANLQSKTDGGVFLSMSYSFIPGVKEVFQKPFKGSDPAPTGGASVAGTSSDNTPAPAGADGAACEDKDAAGVDADKDGVTADKDPDDCDPGTK